MNLKNGKHLEVGASGCEMEDVSEHVLSHMETTGLQGERINSMGRGKVVLEFLVSAVFVAQLQLSPSRGWMRYLLYV